MTAPTFPANVVPNDEAAGIPDLVPGAEMLGYGFNIFHTYSFESAIRPLFKLGAPSNWTAGSGKTYSLPANVGTPGGSMSSARATAFDTASEFNSYFQSSASVSGSVGAFSASFSTSYSNEQQSSSSNSWALVEAEFHAWEVKLAQRVLLDGISADPDWSTLPDTFNPRDAGNVLAFFRFFQRFGTHFISNVSVGGTLYYYYSIRKSANMTKTDISRSATFEYQGLISSSKAEAEQKWGNCSQNWTTNRQARALTVPATAAVTNWVNPSKDSYDVDGNFKEWTKAVTKHPSRTKFSLTPIWELFSGARWTALQLAYQAYANTRISVQAWRAQDDTILINGVPMFAPGPAITKEGGWQLVVIDSKSLKPILNKSYQFNYNSTRWPDDTYAAMAGDLRPYVGNDGYMLVAATSFADAGASPNQEVYAMLRSFGAGERLERWFSAPDHGCRSGPGSAAYALVGKGRSATGCESFLTSNENSMDIGVSVNAFLLPIDGSFNPQRYQT